jgi:Cu+-exporting ATPase
VVASAGFDESEIVRLVASLEQGSEHPLATALVTAATANNISLTSVSEFQSKTGGGVTGRVAGKNVAVGNERFLSELGAEVAPLAPQAEELRRQPWTVAPLELSVSPIPSSLPLCRRSAISALRGYVLSC